MFKEKWENVKSLILKKNEIDGKKNVQNLVAFLIVLIITLVAINTIWNEDKTVKRVDTVKRASLDSNENEIMQAEVGDLKLEQRLESILGKIDGVGKVNVLITYSETSQVVAMYNENTKQSSTEEADSGGGTRRITEVDTSKEMAYQEENGAKTPITEKIIMPKMEGAIVIAEGAGNVEVKSNIILAVEAATGIATHKIQVFSMTK